MRTICPVRKRQCGAVLVMAAFAATAVFGFMGVALNVSHAYDLKSELQNAADAAALAGAKSLNDTTAGINAAVAAAKATALSNKFNFSQTLTLNDADIGFAGNPDATTWLSVAQAQATPAGLLFIKVDTGTHTSVIGSVANVMRVAGTANPLATGGVAVAGRFSLGIAPIAVCALETTKYGQLAHAGLPPELKEFGYRRGINYDLVSINPIGAPANKFLLNPVDAPPGACNPSNSSANKTAPHLCSGTTSIITSLPGIVYVNTGFSSSVEKEINSRFNNYGGGSVCTPAAAPPDSNIKAYTAPSSVDWMASQSPPVQQSIRLESGIPVASGHLTPDIPASKAADYGVLWAYNSAVQYAATPPAGGYTPFTTADWPKLYPAPSPAASSYPATAPYWQTGGAFFTKPNPNAPGVSDRRVLNIAIVDCNTLSGSGSCATVQVLGVGRFFMTVPVKLPANFITEFAGLVPDASLTADIKLYR